MLRTGKTFTLAVYSTSRGVASGPTRCSVPCLLPLLLQGSPKLGDLGFESGLSEFADGPADDLFPRQTEKLARSDARVLRVAIVIGDQDRDGRMIDNRAEEEFQFFRTVLHEPAGGG